MERTRDLGSAIAAAAAGIATAVGFLGLYVLVSTPVVEVLRRLA